MPTWRRAELAPGTYDELISARLERQLAELDPRLDIHRKPVAHTEAIGAIIASLLGEAIELALSELKSDSPAALALAEQILAVVQSHVRAAFPRDGELRLKPERLLAITRPPAVAAERPIGSLHASSLIVNAEGDRLLDHLRSEFDSADRVDLLCAFVKLSGFEKLRQQIERHAVGRGRPLRVLTTTYMAASDPVAIERLAALLNTIVKISYDENATRLHAKAWMFHRLSGFSTAYVGSSNLSHAAQTEGLEWNIRFTESDQPALFAQMQETFAQYWADAYHFEEFDHQNERHRSRLRRALAFGDRGFAAHAATADIEPKDYQKPVLDELTRARTWATSQLAGRGDGHREDRDGRP
jgi:HKD family nuclease